MRKISALAGVALVVVLALPAQAKVAGSAYINGPGLPSGGISVDGGDSGGWPAESGLLHGDLLEGSAPPGDLGPRYTVTYVITQPPGQPDIAQHLYPYADAGPVVFTPGGQEWIGATDGTTPAGWFAADRGLMDLLVDAGLPGSNPVPEPVSAPDPSPAMPWAIAGLLAGGLLIAGAVALRRTRPAAQRAAVH